MKVLRVEDEAHAEAKAAAALAGIELNAWATAAVQAMARQQLGRPNPSEEEPRLDRRAAS